VDVRDAIRKRRSIKHFDPAHRMPPEHVEELLDLARLAPTAFNIQHCRLVVVDDPDLRRELRRASFEQAQVTDASLLVVVCADLRAWAKQPERYWRNAPTPVRDAMVGMITRFYAESPQLQRDEAMRSCAFAAQTLMLAAQDLGYESCPLDGFDFDAVARLINLPDDHVLSMFVAIGKALQPANPRGGQIPRDEAILRNRF
jgi:nitroreductase